MDSSLERYSRQMRFYGIGEEGQRRLLDSHVTLCGCGALGTVLANALVRGGVGHLRLIDMAMQILKVCLLSSGLQVKPGAPAPVDAYLPDMQPVNC